MFGKLIEFPIKQYFLVEKETKNQLNCGPLTVHIELLDPQSADILPDDDTELNT